MPHIEADWIKELTATAGTGTLTLAGADGADSDTFDSAMNTGDTCSYVILSATRTERETGIGTFTAPNLLARTTVKSSTNAGAIVNFGAGVKTVFIGPISKTNIPYNPTTNKLGLSIGAHSDTVLASPQIGQAIKFDGTNWTNQPDAVNVGTVTSVSGAGTVSGLTLTGTVTASGSLTLGGTLSAIPLATGVSGTLPVANGGTGVTTSTGTTNVVLSNSPTLVTPLSNTLSAIPVTTGLTATSLTASSSGTEIIYSGTGLTFTVGRTVSVTGLSPSTYNISGLTITSATASEFRVASTVAAGSSTGTGTATAGGNTLADAASNAVTAGPGGNRVITAGNGVGVGKGGNVILQPGAQGSSGGNGVVRPNGVITQGENSTAIEFLNTIPQAATVATSFNNAKYRFRMDRSGVEAYIIMSRGKLTVPSITNVPTIQIGESADNQPESSGFQNEGIGNVIGSGGIGLFASHSPRLWCFQSMTGITTSLGFGPVTTSTDVAIGRAEKGILRIADGSNSAALNTSGGSLSFPSNTTGGSPTTIATNTDNLVLTGSAFQRINCTSTSNLTGIAPPTGGTHVDGRMIRVYNVGTANLTLVHDSILSTTTNRMCNSTGAAIIIGPNDYAELIYDSTDNGRVLPVVTPAPGWRSS